MKEWKEFLSELHAQSEMQSHQKLKLMSKIVNEAKNRRFDTDRHPKNNLVEHGFKTDEFRRFMAAVERPEDRLCFLLIALLGLRPNEAARLRGRDVQGDRLLIPSSKGGFESDLKLPDAILGLLPMVGPDEPLLGMSQAVMGRHFRECRERAMMGEMYGRAKPGGHNRRYERPLFRYSMKSLRYTSAQMIRRQTKDVFLAQKLLRHRDIRTTAHYLEQSMRPELEFALERSLELLLEQRTSLPACFGAGGHPARSNSRRIFPGELHAAPDGLDKETGRADSRLEFSEHLLLNFLRCQRTRHRAPSSSWPLRRSGPCAAGP